MIPTLEWLPEGVNFLDQTKLPLEETYVLATDYKQVATVIRDMIVRGAPAIGVAAAMGMALGIERSTATTLAELTAEVAVIAKTLAETRPTAVNLFWGIDEIRGLFNSLGATNTPIPEIKSAVVARARQMYDEDIAACKQMGAHGAALLPMEGTVLTHCNAGALATCGYGTALGVIRAAIERGHKISVFADETRPFLQGARLTAWELMKDNIPTTVICDNMAADHGGGDVVLHQLPGGHRRLGPHCGQRRCGQQDRHLRRRGAGPRARHSVLRCGPVVHG
jgi:methylthioribose-1-phosphate isomerase